MKRTVLYRGGEDSFGLEAIDTLVKGIEDHRGDLVVILAGLHQGDAAVFVARTPALPSRFPNQIEFPDYSGEELYKHYLCSIAKGKGYTLDDSLPSMPLVHLL